MTNILLTLQWRRNGQSIIAENAKKMKKTKKSLERKITYCTCHNARVVGGRKPEYFTKKLLTKHALLEKFPLCAIKLLIYVLWLKNYFCTFNEILKK